MSSRSEKSKGKDKKDSSRDVKRDAKADKPKKKTRASKKKEDKKGNTEVKVAYELTIKGIDQLKPETNGRKAFVSWKRGRKSANKGKTKSVCTHHTISILFASLLRSLLTFSVLRKRYNLITYNGITK